MYSGSVLDDGPYSAPGRGAGHDRLAATALHPHCQGLPWIQIQAGGVLPITALGTFSKFI